MNALVEVVKLNWLICNDLLQTDHRNEFRKNRGPFFEHRRRINFNLSSLVTPKTFLVLPLLWLRTKKFHLPEIRPLNDSERQERKQEILHSDIRCAHNWEKESSF